MTHMKAGMSVPVSMLAWSSVLLRFVGNPGIAFDLAVETLATLRRRWSERPAEDEQRLIWAFESSHALLAVAVAKGAVPCIERTRDQRSEHRTLLIAEQQQIISLSEQWLDVPSRVHDVVDALARDAPPPRQLTLRCSPLVDVEPLPDLAREPDGA